jgi:hypothetical protein
MSFKVGDWVTWKSQANGSTRVKMGRVVGVVPAKHHKLTYRGLKYYVDGLSPSEVNQQYNTGPIDAGGIGRDHESYLVRVSPPDKSKAKPKLYWPRVVGLKLT